MKLFLTVRGRRAKPRPTVKNISFVTMFKMGREQGSALAACSLTIFNIVTGISLGSNPRARDSPHLIPGLDELVSYVVPGSHVYPKGS